MGAAQHKWVLAGKGEGPHSIVLEFESLPFTRRVDVSVGGEIHESALRSQWPVVLVLIRGEPRDAEGGDDAEEGKQLQNGQSRKINRETSTVSIMSRAGPQVKQASGRGPSGCVPECARQGARGRLCPPSARWCT